MEASGARPVTKQESGFVVEDRSTGQPVYYDCMIAQGGTFGWNPDVNKALRFARMVDGERFIAKHLSYGVGTFRTVPYEKQ